MDDVEYAMCSRCGAWVEFCQCVDRAELEKERTERAEERRAWIKFAESCIIVNQQHSGRRWDEIIAAERALDDAKQKLIELGVPEDDLP